jgi:class 3 adenylate cyclase
MAAAAILFADIVGFSRKPTAEQKRLVESLASEVVGELKELLVRSTGTPNIIALPTGDGLALGFLHRTNQSWDRSTILDLILRMHQWADKQSSPNNSVSLRIGIHVGAVELITDINGKRNICGDTINYAQRVMDAAGPRQTLFSDAAFREYVGAESTEVPLSKERKGEFFGPIEVFAKHGLQIQVYKLSIDPPQPYYCNDDPISKHLMLVTLTPLPKEIAGSFSGQISQATDIAFIQLTGDRFLSKAEEGKIVFSKHLKRFWVFMPAPAIYANLHLTEPQATSQLVEECMQKWQVFLHNLEKKFPNADLKLGLFKEPPYFGASFIDWGRPEGKIHVSPYVWDVSASNCPGYDLQWIGKKPSSIYEIYVRSLDYLHRNTENELKK